MMNFYSYVCWLHKCLLLKSVCSYSLPTFDGVVFLDNLFKFSIDQETTDAGEDMEK